MKHKPSMAMPAFTHSYSSGVRCTNSETYSLHKLQGKPRLLQASCRWTCHIWVHSALRISQAAPSIQKHSCDRWLQTRFSFVEARRKPWVQLGVLLYLHSTKCGFDITATTITLRLQESIFTNGQIACFPFLLFYRASFCCFSYPLTPSLSLNHPQVAGCTLRCSNNKPQAPPTHSGTCS